MRAIGGMGAIMGGIGLIMGAMGAMGTMGAIGGYVEGRIMGAPRGNDWAMGMGGWAP